MSGADPNDPFANPSWAGGGYPAEPPSAPPPSWAPPPPPPPSTPKRSVWPVVVAVVAGFGAMLAVLGFLASRDDDDDGDDTDRDDVADTVDEADLTDPGGPTVEGGDFAITLPVGWVGTDLSAGAVGAGAELFPSDPDAAGYVDAMLSGGVATAERAGMSGAIAGFDAEALQDPTDFPGSVLVFGVPAELGEDAERAIVEFAAGVQSTGGDVRSREVVELDGRQVGRVVVGLDDVAGGAGLGLSSVNYLFVDERALVVFSLDDVSDASLAEVDASAATLTAD